MRRTIALDVSFQVWAENTFATGSRRCDNVVVFVFVYRANTAAESSTNKRIWSQFNLRYVILREHHFCVQDSFPCQCWPFSLAAPEDHKKSLLGVECGSKECKNDSVATGHGWKKQSSVGFSWWNWKLTVLCCSRGFIAPDSAAFTECTNFDFGLLSVPCVFIGGHQDWRRSPR